MREVPLTRLECTLYIDVTGVYYRERLDFRVGHTAQRMIRNTHARFHTDERNSDRPALQATLQTFAAFEEKFVNSRYVFTPNRVVAESTLTPWVTKESRPAQSPPIYTNGARS